MKSMQMVNEKYSIAGSELAKKLAMSREGMKAERLRTIRCPCCGFYLLEVAGYDHYYISVKCRKCKFNEVIDTALFRTLKYLNRRRKPFDNHANKRGKRCVLATTYNRKRKD